MEDIKHLMDFTNAIEKKKQTFDGIECWSAREITPLLKYDKYEDFVIAIEEGKRDCAYQGLEVSEFFLDRVNDSQSDILLSLYGLYRTLKKSKDHSVEILWAADYFVAQPTEKFKSDVKTSDSYFFGGDTVRFKREIGKSYGIIGMQGTVRVCTPDYISVISHDHEFLCQKEDLELVCRRSNRNNR